MPTQVLMPQLGESIAEGTIVRWNKRVGDPVERDEPLFEISTDKVDAEIPSPAEGVVAEIRVPEGETVAVDTVVAFISEAGTPAEAVAGPAPPAAPPTVDAPPPGRERTSRPPGRYSPVVRRLAREHDIDLTTVEGTGAGGRVTRDDVLRAVEDVGSAPVAPVDATSGDAPVGEPLSVMRRQIAERMVASRRTSAHVHTVFDVDFTRVAELRTALRAAGEDAPSYLAFVARAVVDGLRAVPVVNARLEGERLVHSEPVHLGIAVALDHGLIVPVIRNAQELGVAALGRAADDLASRARTKALVPDDVAGGTFTITNPGVFGSILGTPIINQPQLAILCVGAVEARPVVVEGEIVVRTRSYLTLGFDHRVIDGAVADRFMGEVKASLERFDDARL